MQAEEEKYIKRIRANIKKYRKQKNISQERLAEIVNCSREHLSRIESGKLQPGIILFINLAQALGISLDDMIS